MRQLLSSILATLAVALPAVAAPPVVMAELDWNGARAVQHVLRTILQDRLGVAVTLVPHEPSTLLEAMDKGEIEIFPDLWMPDQAAGFARYVKAGSRESVLVNARPYPGTQGFYVPAYVAEEHGVSSVADLRKPAVAGLFDTDGDGRPAYWPGPPGWSSTAIHQAKARSYGFDGLFDTLQDSEAAFKARLRGAYRNHRPVLFYGWTPDGIHASLDLRALDEPAHQAGCWKMVMPDEDPDWLTKSDVRCASPPSSVYVAYTRSLAQRLPHVGTFLRQVALDGEMLSGWIVLIADYDVPPDEMAGIWVSEHPEIVDQWLAGVSIP